MDIQELKEIIDCMPKGRTFFPYYQNRYAPMLLAWIIGEYGKVSDIKQSRYAGLLDKPPVKNLLATSGKGTLSADALSLAWAEPHDQFLLTLGQWGGDSPRWQQTSRAGYNLVLQLNVHEGYRKAFTKYLPEDYQYLLEYSFHPVLNKGERELFRQTLGWVRMDIDFATGEALIEEIQSDWIRDLQMLKKECATDAKSKAMYHYSGFVIERFGKIWDEALLCAALWFLIEEMGLTTIWYHTFETGNQLKRIKYRQPPRSLYSKLPRKFCFTETSDQPLFLSRDKSYRRFARAYKEPRWFQMQM